MEETIFIMWILQVVSFILLGYLFRKIVNFEEYTEEYIINRELKILAIKRSMAILAIKSKMKPRDFVKNILEEDVDEWMMEVEEETKKNLFN